MNSIDALSLVSLSPSHRLDAAGTWSSISIRYYLIFKDYSKSSIWHSIPTHACNALKDEYLIHSHVSHCLRMFIWVTWYIIIYWLTDWWLMRFDENCWQTVFRLKLKLASEHRTRTEPPYANLIKTLCTLSCKMCKSKLKQHCQILPAYKDMKLETTLSELSCFHSNSLDFSVMSWYSGTCSWHQLTMWCDADQLAQVDDVGNAWVAGGTHSSLDGHTNAGSNDIFLMKFDAQGVHLWTRQRGGGSWDEAQALQADGVRLRFRIFSMEKKHGKTLI